MTLESLASMVKFYRVVKYLKNHKCDAEEIRTQLMLTKKQFYVAMVSLKKNNLVKKNTKYALTTLATDILKHVEQIEKLESMKTEYKAIEAAKYSLSQQELDNLRKILVKT